MDFNIESIKNKTVKMWIFTEGGVKTMEAKKPPWTSDHSSSSSMNSSSSSSDASMTNSSASAISS